MKPGITDPNAAPLWRRLAWFVALWIASVAALGLVAYGLRWLLHA